MGDLDTKGNPFITNFAFCHLSKPPPMFKSGAQCAKRYNNRRGEKNQVYFPEKDGLFLNEAGKQGQVLPNEKTMYIINISIYAPAYLPKKGKKAGENK
ncbi:MAG: hypothetical protein ACOX0U_01255 [Oscillospiraceae bacterium]|jgi:hypothetical protein